MKPFVDIETYTPSLMHLPKRGAVQGVGRGRKSESDRVHEKKLQPTPVLEEIKISQAGGMNQP